MIPETAPNLLQEEETPIRNAVDRVDRLPNGRPTKRVKICPHREKKLLVHTFLKKCDELF